jgi:magnesium transporter
VGEVRLADWWRVVRRELVAGLSLGVMLGLIGFLRVVLFPPPGDPAEHAVGIGITVGAALLGVVLWGCLAGSLLPLLLKRLGLDPATSSAPFVATLVDVTGLVIYFTVASLLLSGTVL